MTGSGPLGAGRGPRVRSALPRLDGTFEPPHLAAAACRLGMRDRRLVLRSIAPHLAELMDLVGWSRIPGLLMLVRDDGRSTAGTGCDRRGDRGAPLREWERASLPEGGRG